MFHKVSYGCRREAPSREASFHHKDFGYPTQTSESHIFAVVHLHSPHIRLLEPTCFSTLRTVNKVGKQKRLIRQGNMINILM